MKKLTFMAIAMGMLALAACSEKKTQSATEQLPEKTIVTDSAFQQAAAGDYKSADGKRIISLNSDFTVKTTGLDKEYYKWELVIKPEGTATTILLDSKGIDADVQEQAALDTEDGSIIVKNETFRKADKK